MLRLILPMVAATVVSASVSAQRPTPPVPPARPVPATPVPAPSPGELEERLRLEADRIRLLAPEIELRAMELQELELMRWHEMEPRLHDLEFQLHIDELALQHDWDLQAREWERQALEWERQWELQSHEWEREWAEQARQWELQSHEWERQSEMMRHEALAPLRSSFAIELPESPYPQDPADSLYRAAREMLNRGEYRRAAQTFRSIGERFPTSRYAPDALYYEAFALYRIGTVAEMRNALALLEQQRQKFPRSETDREAASLAMRIRGELAANGDARAASEIADAASRRTPPRPTSERTTPSPGTAPTPPARLAGQNASRSEQGAQCDRDSLAVKLEALSALSKIESPEVTPALRRVLQRRDECSASLRRRAVLLLGQQAGAEIGDVLIDVAKNDPDVDVKREAIGMLAKVPTDQAVNALQEIVQTGDTRLTSSAMRALQSNTHPRSSQAVRTVLERNDIAESVRLSALSSFSRATPEEAAYLRSVYPKLESRRLRSQAISTIARIGGPENEQWLMALARNDAESMELRGEAVARLASSAPIPEVAKLYDQATDRRIKERIIGTLASRKEPEAVDKLIAIARSDADQELRRQAIARLSQKKDPRTTQLLLEIIGR